MKRAGEQINSRTIQECVCVCVYYDCVDFMRAADLVILEKGKEGLPDLEVLGSSDAPTAP